MTDGPVTDGVARGVAAACSDRFPYSRWPDPDEYDGLVPADQRQSSTPPPLHVWWRAVEPDPVTALMLRLGAAVHHGSIPLGAVVLTVVAAESEGFDRLEVGEPMPESMAQPNSEPGPRLAALGWATVDAERFAAALGKPLLAEVRDDPALGATAYGIASATLPLVLLEPATEGRIAAALARLGEGPVALYLEGVTLRPGDDATPIGRTGTGREGRLLRPPRPWGPFIVALEP